MNNLRISPRSEEIHNEVSERTSMILTKPLLKKWLKEYEVHPKTNKSERQLQTDLKCLVFRYELTKEEGLLDEIFVTLLDLCHIKVPAN